MKDRDDHIADFFDLLSPALAPTKEACLRAILEK